MSSWGKVDQASSAPKWAVNATICKAAPSEVNARPNATNVAYLYGNTAPSAYITNETVGLFMVDSTEEHAGSDNVTDVSISSGGTQYAETPTVSFSGGGGSGAAATATISGGVVTKIVVTNVGSSYETVPTVTVTAPSITFDASSSSNVVVATDIFNYTGHRFVTGDAVTYVVNGAGRVRGDVVTVNGSSTGVVNTVSNIITSTGHPFLTGDEVFYEKSGSNPIAGLTTATSYFIEKIDANRFALYDTYAHSLTHDGTGLLGLSAVGNGTTDTFKYIFNANQTYYVIRTTANAFKLARTAALATAGTPIDLSAIFGPAGSPGTQLVKTSGAATAIAIKGLGQGGGSDSGFTHAPHVGWNLKRVGTGGRAGRVQFETLVALSSPTGDGSDDIALPDA